MCVASPVGELVLDIEARCYGNILLQSRGNNGFGYDPIFQEKNTELTFAEMTDDLKDKLSHRGKAASKVIPELIKIFSDI